MGLKDVVSRILGASARDPAPAPPPASPFEPLDPVDHLLAHVQPAVDAGFSDRREILELANDVAAEERLPLSPEEIASIVDGRLAEHAARQAAWPAVTDNDRLDAAAAALEASGIVFRQNFTCCGTCGSAEIHDEIAKVRDEGREVRGYAFYHFQDAEGAATGSPLFLSYGSADLEMEECLAIAHEIAGALRARGLAVGWDGSIGMRIRVDLEWRRRRPAV